MTKPWAWLRDRMTKTSQQRAMEKAHRMSQCLRCPPEGEWCEPCGRCAYHCECVNWA